MDIDINKSHVPKISVLMPAYNCESTIVEAIESILKQTFDDFELIIINDGSTDKTLEKIKQFSDRRIKIINNEHNFGIIKSLNIGLSVALGEYIARMDSDDISMPNRLEKQIKYLDTHKDTILLGTGRMIFGEGIKSNKQSYPESDEDIRAYAFIANPFIHPALMFRRTVIDSGIVYKKEYKYIEDYKLILDVMSLGKVHNLPEVLIKYRLSLQQISSVNQFEQQKRNRQLRIETTNKFLQKYSLAISDELDNEFFKLWSSLKIESSDKKIIDAVTLSIAASKKIHHGLYKYLSSCISHRYFSLRNFIRLLLCRCGVNKYSGLGLLD